jgi:hypothetical protein
VKAKRLAALAAAAALLGAAALVIRSDIVQALLGRWSFTKSVEVDRGTYYRLKVNLAYKSEPLAFDVVVGCNVKITRYKDNSRTVETAIAPYVYGLKMPDGRGVVVRPPEACGGETTEDGRVPATLLPLIVTYDRAEAPWFGVAYASDDAYENPHSELKFFGATISAATRAEWENWRRTEAPKNFITYALLGVNAEDIWTKVKWQPGQQFMPHECQAVARVKLSDYARDIVSQHWPTHRPTYWYPDQGARRAVFPVHRDDPKDPARLFEGYEFEAFLEPLFNGLRGEPRRKPGAVIRFPRAVSGAVFPAQSDMSLAKLGPDGRMPAEIQSKKRLLRFDAIVHEDLKGLAYCDRVTNIEGLPFDPNGGHERVYENQVNGEPIDEQFERVNGSFQIAFERDEYVLIYKAYPVVNIFGGL